MYRFIFTLLFSYFSLTSLANAKQVYTMEKVALQMAMYKHIENNLIDGVYPHVKLLSGSVVDLVPTKAHPMILVFGDKFVLCTDFRNPDGKFVNVDFYLAAKGKEYSVFQTEIDNRKKLKALMDAGKVSSLN